MSWTRAVHLKAWADTQEARHTLPYLVRRLVRAVTPRSATVLFPAHEQVQRPGFDGVVEASAGSQFVPNGKSVWEMGADGDPASKANGDYAKRTEETDAIMRSDCTFVFVTPREWRKKDDWATEKRASGDWKDVCAFDANDLEHWLDICPREDIWFSAMTGRRPAGVRDLRLKWDGLKAVAEHPLTPEVFLASREQTRAALSTWSREGAASAVLSCESIGDGIDFLTAFVAASSPNSEELDRIIFAESIDAWRRLAASRDPLFLVASDALRLTADDVAEAVEIGHHVLVVAGRAPCAVGRVIELPRQESNAVETALTKCGFDAARSHSLARASCGSSSILKRLMSRHPQTVYPDWSKPGSREELAAYSLVGGWMHVDPRPSENELFPSKPPIDISCVEYLTGNSQESIEQAVARWSSCDEPLFLHFHKSVLVASREDAWHLLAGAITPEQLARFEELATLVLEEDDPSFELDKYERWLANIRGKVHSLSNDMRRGVVETLALMATYPIANVPAFDLTFDAAVRRVLDRVLPPDASWARWATLDRYLPMLAEADPDFLLGRIEADLSLSSPQIASLYRNGGDGLFSGQLHCGLLWALEVLAWDVAYLPRVSAVLAKLADVERSLDHKTGNSATNSFHAIYLSWLPQTNATVEQRISSLRALLKRHSDVAWPLIVGMLPDGIHAVSHPTQQPRWRNWAAGWSREYAHRDYIAYVAELVALTIETAGQSLVRWSEILDGVLQFTGEIAANTLSQLATIAAKSSDNAGRDTLWRTIRDMTARHRAYANANWALPEEILISLDQIQSQLTPGAIVVLHSWLFDHHPDLPGFDGAENFEKYDSELQARRVAALREIVDAEGWDGVACLLEDAEAVNVIGWIVGEHSLLDVSSIALWSLVTAENPRLNEFAARYVAGSIHAKGIQYLSLIGLHD